MNNEIHSQFEAWLNNGRANLERPEHAIRDLRALFQTMTYGCLHLAEDGNPFLASDGALIFPGTHSFELDRTEGDCGQLIERTRRLFAMKHGNSGVVMQSASGEEARFFITQNSHRFLIGGSPKKSWTLDPTFKTITPYPDPNYTVRTALVVSELPPNLQQHLA